MKINYTGRQVELKPPQLRKIEAQFSKVSKLLDGREEREAHVVLSLERHLHRAEVTVNYHHHQLVGIATNNDLFKAIHDAAAKLEKQTLKVRAKWRDTKRTPRKGAGPTAAPETESAPERQVFRVNGVAGRKPMTLDEAMLEMEQDRDYIVYRDAASDRFSVLLRRRDGNFDLVES